LILIFHGNQLLHPSINQGSECRICHNPLCIPSVSGTRLPGQH
jgi:hypothetical protein